MVRAFSRPQGKKIGVTESARTRPLRHAVGFLVGVSCFVGLLFVFEPMQARIKNEANREINHLQPEVNIQEDGPLLSGTAITLPEAKKMSPYSLPVPPTNAETDERSGIWIDAGKQIAFVWETDMRFYVSQSDELTQEEALSAWVEKVASDSDYRLVSVRGHQGLGFDDGEGGDPVSVTFIERGLSIQFVTPAHSLKEIEQFAGAIQYEG